jgi:glycerophosphoryl diester phosphodiesterase
MPVPIIAHRTCPLDAPENTIAGIRKAAELGADGVEIDVRRTLEGTPVLMHDWSPRRTTGLPGPTWLYPYAVLRCPSLELDGIREHVPTLSDAFDALPEPLFIAVELKETAAAASTLRLIRERKLEERALVWSYQERVVRYFAKWAPEVEAALLRDDTDPEGLTRFLDDAVHFGARAISPHWAAITPQLVAEAHDRGLRVFSMNRDLDNVAKKAAAGLDGIVTDNPREVRAILSNGAA